MKTLIFILMGFCSFLAINQENNKPNSELYNLEGVWELQHQFMYQDNHIADTLLNQNGYRQIKMYSQGKVMWTRYDPKDSNEWFGYGTYTIKDGILEERLEYASGSMMKILDTTKVFTFELIVGPDSYQQIDLDENGHYYHAENYKRIK